jgi:protein ImuA
LIDVHCDALGIGELSLLLKAQRGSDLDRGIAWLNAPALPYAPALLEAGIDPSRVLIVQPDNAADNLWAAEQILRSGAVGVLFLWLRQPIEYSQLRRLHLAAEAGQVIGFAFRSTAFMSQPSPAPLRLSLAAKQGRLVCNVFKARSLITSRQVEVSALDDLLQPHGPVPRHLLQAIPDATTRSGLVSAAAHSSVLSAEQRTALTAQHLSRTSLASRYTSQSPAA